MYRFRSIAVCGSAALPCGKALPFRTFAVQLLLFGEAMPRRSRRSLNLAIRFDGHHGKAKPFRKAGRRSRWLRDKRY